jgi:transposase
LKGQPPEEIYRLKKEVLGELETFSESGLLDLYYGDESGVSLEPCVPYGWQFADERVSMPTGRGKGINCFGLFTRSNKAVAALSENSITADFVVEQLERLSFSIKQITVVVLDNARIHTGKQMRERIGHWQRRGLFIFYLPTYSPHLNIAETVWQKLKYEWLAASDYEDGQRLRYSVRQILNEFGKSLRINFSDFSHSLN